MTITRASAEAILVRRLGPLMTKAGLAVTFTGSNADLSDPLGWGFRQAGYTLTSFTTVSDTDLAGVSGDDLDEMLDLAELRLLENILGNLDGVDVRLGPREEKLSQLTDKIERRIKALREKLELVYNWSASVLTTGFIGLEFAQHTGDDTEIE